MVSDPKAKTRTPFHSVLAVVLQVRDDRLQVLLWERALDPFRDSWSLPGGTLAEGETLEGSIRRHLATKVDVQELSHLEQLETRSDPGRNPLRWELATAYLGLVPSDVDPELPPDTRWHAGPWAS
jgi:ADP-ribose pyrophosphatase YjhB (NUDIX family)